jgi:DNA-binding transcriptional LysR family regulator
MYQSQPSLGHVDQQGPATSAAAEHPSAFCFNGLLQPVLELIERHSAREFYASFMGCGVRFESHAGSKQCVFALVAAAGFGITLATTSQAEVVFPGVVYRPIREENAWVQVELVWCPEAEDPAVGRFVAFMRDEARSRQLF